MDTFHISATGLSMNYLPQYIAEDLGYFEEEQIQVTSKVPTDWTQVLRDIDSGKAQAALGGIWVPAIYKQHRIKDYCPFAKLSSKCPMVLVSREPAEQPFDWKYLEGKQILCPGGNGVSPYMFLAGCMKENGVYMDRVRWVHDFTAGMLFEGFCQDWGDLILLPPHMAQILYDKHLGYECCDLAVVGGDVPWSVYYCVPALLEREDHLTDRFCRALQKGMDWLLSHDAGECEVLLAKLWPKVPSKEALEKINRLKQVGMWSGSLEMEEEEFLHYEVYMVETGIIDRPLSKSELFFGRL